MQVRRGRIAAIRARAPRGAQTVDLHDAYLAPGFIDLHVWGEPDDVAREAVRHGTTAFLRTLGPDNPKRLLKQLAEAELAPLRGAQCLGTHLEGPFVNPARGGALPRRGMRHPTLPEIRRLTGAARGRLKLVTIAPELPGAAVAIRWLARHRVCVSLGHSVADEDAARWAVAAGARAVTHVFNGMPRLDPRRPSLLDAALADPRLTGMVIADGLHVGPAALRLLIRAKGPAGVALVTDNVGGAGWDLQRRRGAYYTRSGILAGSGLTMMRAVRNAVALGGASLADAVRMATGVPARLLGLRDRGRLVVGARADLVAFDAKFRVRMTIVGGRIAYQR